MTLDIPKPNPRQAEFLADRHNNVGFGGARGGGKSWVARTKALLLGYEYPGIKIIIIRKTYPELLENHILPLCELLRTNHSDPRQRLARYNDSKKYILFPNGSRIIFRYCDNDRDTEKFQGIEVDVEFLEEATQYTEEQMKKLTACVRGVNAYPKRKYYTFNPGGVGHGWVKRLFIDRHYKDAENPEDYSFIQSLVTDNTALMRANPDYIAQLKALPPKLREAWLYGNWDIYEGQFFEDLRLEPDTSAARAAGCGLSADELREQGRWCHVIPAFDLNSGERRGWNIMRSYDWGYNKPFSCAWWAVDYDGTLYRIMEMYGCTDTPNEGVKWSTDEQFRRISALEREHPWLKGRKIVDSVADPSIWDASRGESTAEIAARYGVFFTPGDNKRLPGWMQVHYRLQFDTEGYPRMYIFDNCKAFIRTMPALLYSRTDPEDLDSSMEDHVADEVRYMCMSRPVKPVIAPAPKVIVSDPLNQFTKRR